MPRRSHEQRVYGDRYQRVRLLALERDGFRCQACHSTEELEAHHKPMAYPRYETDEHLLGDLLTLCRTCHDAITNERRRKRNSVRANRRTHFGQTPDLIPSHLPTERPKVGALTLLGDSAAQAAHQSAFKNSKR